MKLSLNLAKHLTALKVISLFLDNMHKGSRDVNTVRGAFYWEDTPQGHKFWREIERQVELLRDLELIEIAVRKAHFDSLI